MTFLKEEKQRSQKRGKRQAEISRDVGEDTKIVCKSLRKRRLQMGLADVGIMG